MHSHCRASVSCRWVSCASALLLSGNQLSGDVPIHIGKLTALRYELRPSSSSSARVLPFGACGVRATQFAVPGQQPPHRNAASVAG
jgi:hypothetical protein